MEHPKVRFVASEQFPKIIRMAEFAASLPGWTAILNADIVIKGNMKGITQRIVQAGAKCAVSQRYEFASPDPQEGKVVDLGLDFFLANQDTWRRISEEYPEHYRFGHSSWDALMLGAFNCIGRHDCHNITAHRFCFHPRHGERRQVFHINDTVQTRFRDAVFLPRQRVY